VLRDEKIALIDETAVNETLGETVANRVKAKAKLQEANKFKIHVQEVGQITSLLLSLSGRLARVENALLDVDPNNLEKVKAGGGENEKHGAALRRVRSPSVCVTPDRRAFLSSNTPSIFHVPKLAREFEFPFAPVFVRPVHYSA